MIRVDQFESVFWSAARTVFEPKSSPSWSSAIEMDPPRKSSRPCTWPLRSDTCSSGRKSAVRTQQPYRDPPKKESIATANPLVPLTRNCGYLR